MRLASNQGRKIFRKQSDVDDDGSGTIGYEELLKMMTHKIQNHNTKDKIIKTHFI